MKALALDYEHSQLELRDVPEPGEPAPGPVLFRIAEGGSCGTDRDLARWAGIPLRDARAGLAAAGPPPKRDRPELPPPRLLGAFEPCLLGWASREDIVGPDPKNLVTVGGMFHPFAMVGGRAVARWKLSGGEVKLEPFSRIARADREALERDAADVRRFLGATPSE